MNGILLVDKPASWTSSDVVVKLKGALHERRIGHSGTLDPMATGLLTVFVGRATRAVEFAEAHDKRYIASLRLGLETDTQDITGTVTARGDASEIDEAALEAALPRFTGKTEQLPPMYSAVKVNGRRLYDIARRGGEAERKPRPVEIKSLRLISREGEDYVLDVSCSKGTYIRTLCADIGAYLGCGGCMSALRRVEAGAFSVNDAHSLDEILNLAAKGEAERLLLPIDTLFSAFVAHTVSETQEKRIRNGGAVKANALSDGKYRVYSPAGEFLMLGRARGGVLTTIKSFFEV